jgi:hypothetical protein
MSSFGGSGTKTQLPEGLHSELQKCRHQMDCLVDQMLATKKRLASAMSDTDRERHQNKCEYLDAEIDKLVYALYGLTAEEIRIVEGA